MDDRLALLKSVLRCTEHGVAMDADTHRMAIEFAVSEIERLSRELARKIRPSSNAVADFVDEVCAERDRLRQERDTWHRVADDYIQTIHRLRAALERIASLPDVPQGMHPIGPLAGAGLAEGLQLAAHFAREALGGAAVNATTDMPSELLDVHAICDERDRLRVEVARLKRVCSHPPEWRTQGKCGVCLGDVAGPETGAPIPLGDCPGERDAYLAGKGDVGTAPPHPGPSIEKAFARSPRRVDRETTASRDDAADLAAMLWRLIRHTTRMGIDSAVLDDARGLLHRQGRVPSVLRSDQETGACQHDLLLPNTTVTVDPDGYGGKCSVCETHYRLRPLETNSAPSAAESTSAAPSDEGAGPAAVGADPITTFAAGPARSVCRHCGMLFGHHIIEDEHGRRNVCQRQSVNGESA